MIRAIELHERAAEWALSERTVEKDYVLGWLLWGIATDPILGEKWIFKGGTCLKKCFVETHRFSEDLDFTVIPDGPVAPEELALILAPIRCPASRMRRGLIFLPALRVSGRDNVTKHARGEFTIEA